MAWRALLAVALVVAAAAATTVVFVHGQFVALAHALASNKSVTLANGTLAPTGFGGPQTLLLIGNDQRLHTTTTPVVPHANEMLLVRIDPGKPWISMMSIPRELQVTFNPPCAGLTTTRLNAALICGIGRTVSMIKQVTGLSINHVVEIDFNNFKRAVNEMGCVYGEIDRRYFHVNVPGGPQYFQVNLQPGYQKLCGEQALQFVTYRHGDTSLERDARDQDFLLEVKQQYGPTLIDRIAEFEHIFGQTVQTDQSLHTPAGVANLVGTLISVASKPVRQVKFQANLNVQTNCTCVTATPQQVTESVDSFLYGKGLPPAKKSTASLAKRAHGVKGSGAPPPPTGALQGVPGTVTAQAKLMAQRFPFPLEFPSFQVDNGYQDPTALRGYTIPAPGGQRYPIYVAVFSTGLLGQYYDVQGTTWLTAPVFDSPTQSLVVGGRTYYIYYSGQHIKSIAWFANGAGYWVANTLTLGLTNRQMLVIAEHTAPIIGVAAGSVRKDERHQTAAPSTVAVASTATGPLQTVGEVGGVLAFLCVVGGVGLLWWRHRQMRAMRRGLAVAGDRMMALEGQLARVARRPPAGPAPLAASRPLVAAGAGAGFGGVAAGGGGTRGDAFGRPAAVPLGAGRPAAGWDDPGGVAYGESWSGRGERHTYSTRGGIPPIVVAVVAAVVIAGAGVGAVSVISGTANGAVHRSKRRAPTVTVPVAVLNAGTTRGAAGRLAHQLRTKHLDVLGAANLGPPAPGGYEVLYASGARAQARALARILSANSPVVAPMDPAAQGAAGPHARLVVVIP